MSQNTDVKQIRQWKAEVDTMRNRGKPFPDESIHVMAYSASRMVGAGVALCLFKETDNEQTRFHALVEYFRS